MGKVIEEDLRVIEENLYRITDSKAIKDVQRLGGLTNHTYKVETEDANYLFRLPGEGTEEIIDRADEKKSTELACKLGIDTKLYYFGEDGLKIMDYISNPVTMSPDSMRKEENIQAAAELLYRLHNCGENTGVPFEVFEMAAEYERFIEKNQVPLYEDYGQIKEKVKKIKAELDTEEITPVPCHNDPLCENWIRDRKRMYLVDWEYAGMNDPMWDLADVSIEGHYTRKEDDLLLQTYRGRSLSAADRHRFVANKIYLDYLWTLWGKTRVPFDGKEMEDYAEERYRRLKKNLEMFGTL